MSTGSGKPVNRILVSGCTTNFSGYFIFYPMNVIFGMQLSFIFLYNIFFWGGGCTPPPLATNQTKISYPKPIKHSNKTKLRLNESKNNSLDFLIIKTHFSLLKTIFLIKYKIFIQPSHFTFVY